MNNWRASAREHNQQKEWRSSVAQQRIGGRSALKVYQVES